MKKIVLFLGLLGLLSTSVKVLADDSLNLTAKGAIAVDANTGKVLYEKNADQPLAVGSISKLLTAYLVYESISEGKLSWQTPVKISDYSYQLTQKEDVANVPLEKSEYTVKELLEASLISNANSPAISLAEAISGSEPKFVDKMRDKLKSWGIENAKIVNATGL